MTLSNYKCDTCYQIVERIMPDSAEIAICDRYIDEPRGDARSTFCVGIATRQEVAYV